MIYFAQFPNGALKIGTSEDVNKRLLQLERRFNQPLALLGVIPGGRQEEAEIHRRFRKYRYPRSEQFMPVREILVFIGKPILVHPDPQAVEVVLPVNASTVVTVKVDRQVINRLKFVAWRRGISVAELASDMLRAPVDKAYRQELKGLREEEIE